MNKSRTAIEFWNNDNKWRLLAYPFIFIVVLLVWRNLFWDISEFPARLLSGFGGQCLLLVTAPSKAWTQVYFVTMLAIGIIEITFPSHVHGVKPNYTDGQRIGFALLHSFAWTAFAFGIATLFVTFACPADFPK